jgi:O-antigen ligase
MGLPVHWAIGGGLGAIVLAWSAVSSPVGVTSLILLCSVFQRDEIFALSLPLLGGGLKPTDALLLATLGGWVYRQADRPLGRLSAGRSVLVASLAFVGWAVLAAYRGMQAGAFYKDSLLELRPLLQYLLLLPIVTELKTDDIRRICTIFLGAATLVAIKALYLYGTGQGSYASYAGGSIRVTGVNFSVLMIGVLLALALASRGARWKGVYVAAALVVLAGLAVTLQRAAYVAMPPAVLIVALLLPGSQRRRLAKGVLIGGAVLMIGFGVAATSGDRFGALLSAVSSRVASIADFGADVSAQHRFREWRAAVDIMRQHPFAGAGLGTRVGFYSPMYGPDHNQMGYWSEDIYMHNSYMWMLAKTGSIGLILFLLIMLAASRELARYWRSQQDYPEPAILSAFGGVLTVFVVSAAFGPMFNQDTTGANVAFTLGGICVLLKPVVRELNGS